MCTAVSYRTKDHYFGRNLDLDFSYDEKVTICPRNFEIKFANTGSIKNHYAMIGMATIVDGYPLYYDATNEKGLSMAGLNFPDNAYYRKLKEGRENIATYEFILWILSQCRSVKEARVLCEKMNLTNQAFSEKFPVSTLHWIIADKDESIVVESVREGIRIYDNPVGVLTNNPPFDVQLFNLNNYRHLSSTIGPNLFSKELELKEYSRGMGGIGLPGDLSSMSRFVRASFVKLNSVSGDGEVESISQFFKILDSVAQQKGLCLVGESNEYEFTIYSSCVNTTKGIYYYTTYENSQISAVDMNKEDIESFDLISYPLITGQQINHQN